MKFDLTSYGGRRWITSVGIIVTSTALLISGMIDAKVWQEVVIYVFGIFAGANVLQRGVEATKEVKIAKTTTE